MTKNRLTSLGDFLVVDGGFEDRNRDDAVLIPPVFMQTFLPYEDQEEHTVRVAQGDLSASMGSWMENLPSGAGPRWILAWFSKLAHVDPRASAVPPTFDFGPLLDAAVTHAETAEIDPQNLRWVREVFARLLDTDVTVGEERRTGPVRGYRHHTLSSFATSAVSYDDFFKDSDEGDFRISLSPAFIRATLACPAPASFDDLATAAEGGCLGMDMLNWLLFRAGTIPTATCLSWSNTHAQFGGRGDVTEFAHDFKDRLELVSKLLGETRVTADEHGVTIHPA